VGQVLLVAVGYAAGPQIASMYLAEQSSLALSAVSLAVVAVGYLPVAIVQHPARVPPATALMSLVALGLICTALAFVAFFELIKEMPPTQATIITYFNPVVAVALGVAVLDEPFKAATGAGFLLVLGGSWLATGVGRRRQQTGAALPAERRRP
jgi:drug/metabolite transporter (DMT)-like permease